MSDSSTGKQRRPDPPPLDIDESQVIAVGSLAWAIALVVMLILRDELVERDNEWWIAVAIAGLALGCWGWWLVRKRIAARRTPHV